MICNRYCCLLKMSRSLETRTCVWLAKQHKWGWGCGPVVIVVFLWLCGEARRKLWSASHIVHTWDGLGRCARASVESLDQTEEWDQMILTTGKYLWAEKSNSGSAWRRTGRSHQPINRSKSRNSRRSVCYVTLVSFLCPPARSFMTTMLGLATFSIRFTW